MQESVLIGMCLCCWRCGLLRCSMLSSSTPLAGAWYVCVCTSAGIGAPTAFRPATGRKSTATRCRTSLVHLLLNPTNLQGLNIAFLRAQVPFVACIQQVPMPSNWPWSKRHFELQFRAANWVARRARFTSLLSESRFVSAKNESLRTSCVVGRAENLSTRFTVDFQYFFVGRHLRQHHFFSRFRQKIGSHTFRPFHPFRTSFWILQGIFRKLLQFQVTFETAEDLVPSSS